MIQHATPGGIGGDAYEILRACLVTFSFFPFFLRVFPLVDFIMLFNQLIKVDFISYLADIVIIYTQLLQVDFMQLHLAVTYAATGKFFFKISMLIVDITSSPSSACSRECTVTLLDGNFLYCQKLPIAAQCWRGRGRKIF